MCYGSIENGQEMGPLLERARLHMKDSGEGEEGSSIALKIEAIMLAVLWVFALFVTITALV